MPNNNYKVVIQALNLRDEPSIHGKIIDVLTKDDVVEYVSQSGDGYWLKVISPKGITAWASHKYLQLILSSTKADNNFPWLVIAQSEIGTKEFAGSGDNPRIIEYLHSTNLPSSMSNKEETYWCSAFVNWCVERAGFEGTDSAWAKSWLNWGESIIEPVQGCIVVLKRGNGGHVGFYVGQGRLTSIIKVLGGNQHDEVNVSSFRKSDVLGYRMQKSGNEK